MRYLFAVPVWGEFYVEYFLNLSLASMLAPGNLPAFATPDTTTILLYALPSEIPRLQEHPAFQAACAHAQMVTVSLPDHFRPVVGDEAINEKLQLMSQVHQAGILAGQDDPDCCISLANADLIYSDGSLGYAARRMAEGARAVLMAGPRLGLREGRPRIESFRDGGPALAIPPRELVRCIRPALLAEWRHRQWGHPHFTPWPNQIFWPVGDDGLVLRAFHAHPIFVRPERRIERLTSTVDRDYAYSVVADPFRNVFVTDSDEVCLVELCPDEYLSFDRGSVTSNEDSIADWLAAFDPHEAQLCQLLQPILFHVDGDRDVFDPTIRASQEIAERIVGKARARILANRKPAS